MCVLKYFQIKSQEHSSETFIHPRPDFHAQDYMFYYTKLD